MVQGTIKWEKLGGWGKAQKATILGSVDFYMQLWKMIHSLDLEKPPGLTKRIW